MPVNEHSYQYLFPYEKVPFHSKILIYGAGTLGQDYLRQMRLTQYCEVIAIADRNYSQYPPMIVPVISPEQIHEFTFDYAVVALRMAAAFHEVKRLLKKESVPEERIVCIFEREEITEPIFKEQAPAAHLLAEYSSAEHFSAECSSVECPSTECLSTEHSTVKEPAFSKTPFSIAILATGGFGDMVIQKRFVMELIRLAPECRIDFYNIKAIGLLKHLYADSPNVNLVIPDLGSRYRDNYKNYSLALTIEACHFIKVDKWERQNFITEKNIVEKRAIYPEFIWSIDKLKSETDKEEVSISTPAHLTMIRRAYQGLNAYSGFNYNGAFYIRDKNVSIPLEPEWELEFRKLGLNRYITVNFGNGDCADGSKVAKSWSKEKFERLICLFKKKYPQIQVVQLGAADSVKLRGVDRWVLGADFRLSVHLLKNAMLHIDIEGGLVHIATQLGTKCVVLFGPTVKEYYGYEQNTNIQAGNCRNCWGLYSDVNRCARGLEEPVCMSSITPEMVMGHVDKYITALKREGHRHVG